MLRFLFLLVAAGGACDLLALPLWAQAAETDWVQIDLTPPWRGPGYYLSIYKLAFCWGLFALWVRTTDWVNQDCQRHSLGYVRWNSIVFFSFMAAMLLVWWPIPWFALSYFLLLAAYFGPLGWYVTVRNKEVGYSDRVLTKSHLRNWAAGKLKLVGINIVSDDDPDAGGPPLKFKPMGAVDERTDAANLIAARREPGYKHARKALHEALEHRADSVLMEFGGQLVTVRHQIDGVWHNQQSIQRVEIGDPLLVVLKTISGLKPAERRAKQAGTFGVESPTAKYTTKIASQGTETGERVVLQFEGKKSAFKSLESMGMREKMREQLDKILHEPQGFIVFCTMPGGGLSTLYEVSLNATDRFMRNFAGIEEAHSLEREVLNVPITTYDAKAGETPATILPKLIRGYPDVFAVRDLVNVETLNILIEQVTKEKRMVLTTVRAKEAVEALLRVLLFKCTPADFAAVASAVLNMRLVRKLCEKCKEAYPPPPEVLKQMGLPPGRIEAFYRPPTKPLDPKHPEKVCEACQGIGYQGRTGIFELLVVDEGLRNVLARQPKLELLRDAARKARHRTLQDEGLLLVAKGVTSLQELLRVLKV